MRASSVGSKHYAAIFVAALTTIAAQILVSRILSVTFYYHFAFAGITFAMLGLTIGALRVYQKPAVFSAERADVVLAEYLGRFAFNLTAAILCHVWLPGFTAAWKNGVSVIDALPALFLILSAVFLVRAFIDSGVIIALLLTRFPARTGKLYAFDLAGAAVGCIAVILGLKFFDPVSVFLLLSTLLAWLAKQILPQGSEAALARRIMRVFVALMLLLIIQFVTGANARPLFHLTWTKTETTSERPLFERWNTYSRIAITDHDKPEPFGWGFGVKHTQSIEQKFLRIDADAGTVLTKFDGNLAPLRYLHDDIINIGYHVRKPQSVAVIGIGGGRDILSALLGKATRIQGIEMNPATVGALTRTFGDFTGHLDRQPGVSFATAEARSYLTSHDDTYDLIQISLIDTWAATAAGGLTLAENKLYTTEAWAEFLDRLNDGGMLVTSRWYEPRVHEGEFYRMVAIASAVLKARDPDIDPRKHILAARVGAQTWKNGVIALIMSKSPFTGAEIARFEATCRKLNFVPLLTPSYALDDIVKRLATGTADKDYFDSLALDVSPPTDDRPYFFHMLRLRSLLTHEDTPGTLFNLNYKNNQGIYTLLGIFGVTFAATIIFIGWPMVQLYRQHRVRLREAFPFMAYFAAIGLGFMLVEISQMQRLMIFLGHPVYGLSVVLFTLLLASSLGSFLKRHVSAADPDLWRTALLLCIMLAVIGLLTPTLTEQLKYFGTFMRIVASGVILAFMGLFMGMMLPIGVAIAGAKQPHLLPWYWGINGTASVFASVLAVVISLQCGIGTAFWAGVLCYAVCIPLLIARRN